MTPTNGDQGRSFLRQALIGASLANLAFLGVWGVLFQYADPDAFYLVVTRSDFAALTLNLVVAGLLVGSAGWILDRAGPPWGARLAGLVALLTIGLIGNVLRRVLRLTPDDAGRWAGAIPRSAALLLLLLFGLGTVWLALRLGDRLTRALGGLGLVLSPFLVVTLGRGLVACLSGSLDARAAPLPAETRFPASSTSPRVLLVIFDELDFRLGFGERPAGLALPEFDRFRNAALFAEQAQPPAESTNESLPSMIIGRPVRHTGSVSARRGQLIMERGDTLSTDSVTTLFTRARELGVNSALIGWNLPYCRTGLGRGLVECDWWPSGVLLGAVEPLPLRALHQWAALAPSNSRIIHLLRHRGMMGEARKLLADSSLGLIVLHLAVPHYPWIFDAARGRVSLLRFGPRGYLDNLVLADRALGELRRESDRGSMAGRTVFIVTSDHAWRESPSFDGRQDSRVPLMIRFPGQASAETVSARFSTVSLGDLSLAILAGRVRTPADAETWLEGPLEPR